MSEGEEDESIDPLGGQRVTAAQLASLMVERGYKVRKEGEGYRTCCPAHGGQDANMTIRPHPEGGAICTCHSHQCSRKQVAAALGLTMQEIVAERVTLNGSREEPRIFPYRDEQGNALFEVVRTPEKRFAMRLPGQEKGGVGNVRRVLFGLPELLATRPGELVGIAEGEKCAIAVACQGIACTTNPNGAGKWRGEYTEWLKVNLPDRRFVIFPDNDAEGIKHADEVFHSLRHAGLSVRIALIEGLPPKGDVADWLKTHSAAELADLMDPRRHLVSGEIDATDLLKMEFQPIHWAIGGMLPEGLAIFAGPSKSCKSWLCCEIGIAVVSGGKVFGQLPTERGDVLYLALEDSQRRLQDRIQTVLRGQPLPRGLTLRTEAAKVGEGAEDLIDDWLERHPDARLVIVDVFQKIRPSKQSGISEYEQDYESLTSLQRLCRERRVAILMVHHTRKAQADDPYDMISGSVAIQGCADTMMALMRIRGEREATLHCTGRDLDSQSLALEWDNQQCGWRLLGKAEDHRLTPERRQVLEFLRKAKNPVKPGELAGLLGKNPSAIQYLLGQLEDEGLVTRFGFGKYGMSEVQRLLKDDGSE